MLLARINNGKLLGLLSPLMLILGVGLFPEQCAGLKCEHGYNDNSRLTSPTQPYDKVCPKEHNLCYRYTWEASNVKHPSGGCVGKDVAWCFRDIKGYKERGCHVLNTPKKSEIEEKKIEVCMKMFRNSRRTARAGEEEEEGKHESRVILCLCEEDLCNRFEKWGVPDNKIETTTVKEVVTVTEGGKTETTTVGTEMPESSTRKTIEATSIQPSKRRKTVPKEAEFVMYFGIVLVALFALASCYLLLCLDRKWRCGRRK